MNGTLYIVATPIGNLEDITIRAVETLKKADVIFAEDTRVTKRLCDRYSIAAPLRSYHQRSGKHKRDEVIDALTEGKTVALVTDAGTPGVADPGNELIDAILTRLPDVKIIPIPGSSSLTAALSVCGFPTNTFVFVGFLPHKKGRKTALDAMAGEGRTMVVFESPHRIGKLLQELAVRMPARRIAVFRELTKIYESAYRGTVSEVLALFEEGTIVEKGEFVVVVGEV